MKDSNSLIRDAYKQTFFGGVDKVYRKLKEQKHNVTRKQVQEFINKQSLSQINKKNRGFQSWMPHKPLQEFQIDLIYLMNPTLNEGYKYGFVAIDAFTKIGHIELMKKRDTKAITDAFQKILDVMGTPESVYSDDGSEFKSEKDKTNPYEDGGFVTMLKKKNIKQIFTPTHAPMVERFNRTIKEKLEKYKQASNTKTWFKVLPRIIEEYNNTWHSTIKMKPNEAKKPENHDMVRVNLYRSAKFLKRETIKVDDNVRVLLKRDTMTKGYKPRYSSTIYKVVGIDGGLFYLDGTKRPWFRSHLQKVGETEQTEIEPVYDGSMEQRLKNQYHREPSKQEQAEIDRINEDLQTSIQERTAQVKNRQRKPNRKFQQ